MHVGRCYVSSVQFYYKTSAYTYVIQLTDCLIAIFTKSRTSLFHRPYCQNSTNNKMPATGLKAMLLKLPDRLLPLSISFSITSLFPQSADSTDTVHTNRHASAINGTAPQRTPDGRPGSTQKREPESRKKESWIYSNTYQALRRYLSEVLTAHVSQDYPAHISFRIFGSHTHT